MDRRVLIMCDTEASGIAGVVNDSYLDRIERRPSGGVTVMWTDLPDQAMVFEDAAAAERFCRDSPLELFAVSFVPVPGSPPSPPRPVESEADFLKRLHRMVTEGDAKRTPVTPAETDAMGLM